MRWSLEWGPHLEFLEATEDETGETPEALANYPELSEELAEYLSAFWLLSPGRPLGFGCQGGIPMADLAAWCQLFPQDDPRRFLEYLRAMDAEYLDFSAPDAKGQE